MYAPKPVAMEILEKVCLLNYVARVRDWVLCACQQHFRIIPAGTVGGEGKVQQLLWMTKTPPIPAVTYDVCHVLSPHARALPFPSLWLFFSPPLSSNRSASHMSTFQSLDFPVINEVLCQLAEHSLSAHSPSFPALIALPEQHHSTT
jgi:hypothetical protein